MTTYALDTNTVSFFLKANKTVIQRVLDALSVGDGLVIPPTVYYEIRRGLIKKDAKKQAKAFDDFCQVIPIGETTRKMLDEAAEIYAGNRGSKQTIGDSDIQIAAFCIVNGHTLVTNNTRHFEGIEGLVYVDWA